MIDIVEDLARTAPAVTPIARMGYLVLCILLAASAITYTLERLRPDIDLEVIWLRIRSWWFMAFLFFTAVAVDTRLGCLLIAIICYLGLKEYFTLIPTTHADRGALFWSYLVIPVHFYWIYSDWFAMFSIFIPVYLFLFIPVRQVFAGETADFVARTGRIFWGIIFFVYCLSHMAYLVSMGPTRSGAVSGRELLLYLVFLTQINDVCAFLWGKSFGRHKIAPRISPNKTWEGFIGGVLSCGVLALLVRFLTPFSPGAAIFTGISLAISGFFGDLTVAALKRDVGVKDASDFIPGHGGVLDRVNSLTYTAPLFFHFVRYFYY